MGDFSPHLPRSPIPRRLGFVLCFKEPAQDRREASLKTTDERFPLDRPCRTSRSPAGRPPLRQGEDEYAAGFDGDASISRTPIKSAARR
jgi:hypothetical protein